MEETLMFKNKNWYKVLVPELIMAVSTLVVFFGCRLTGMSDMEVIITTAIFNAAAALVTTFNAADFTAAAAITAAISTIFVIAGAYGYIDIGIAAFLTLALAITSFTVFAAKIYGLPKSRVAVSYLVEAATIFLLIYFTLN